MMRMKLGDRLRSNQPKLTLTTLPSHHKSVIEPPGLVTPPLHPAASIPFKWEEAPGRPRIRPNKTLSPCPSPSPIIKPKSARLLELPPRLISVGGKVTDLPSPTTVLHGVVEEEDGASSCCAGGSGRMEGETVEGSFDFSGFQEEIVVKANIIRLRRKRSLFRFSNRRFQLLDNIYGSFKQMILRGRHKRN